MFINFYNTFAYSLYSSDLIINQEVSDRTYLSSLLDDRFITQKNLEAPKRKEKLYLSDVFYNLDIDNNFSANVYFNVESFFKTKIYFNNLVNYPDFNTFFRDNYIVSIKPYLEKDFYRLPLQYEYIKDATSLESGKSNDALIVKNIDVVDMNEINNKYDDKMYVLTKYTTYL